jgi:hypothetical protein
MPATDLTLRAIRDWVGDREIDKGRPYAADGAVRRGSRQANTLKADVRGTADRPYHVRVRLAGQGVVASDCSCPVGTGRCKHVAALLLLYLARPDRFPVLPELDAVLGGMTRDELIALVRRMVRRAPRLERLIVSPPDDRRAELPVRLPQAGGPSDTEALEILIALADRQVGRRTRDGYRQGCRTLTRAAELAARVGRADEFRRHLSGLIEQHRTSRAFREELQSANLLVGMPPAAVSRTRKRT